MIQRPSAPLVVLAVAVAFAAFAGPALADPARYRVHVDDPAPASLRVEAEFDLASDVISMYITGSPQLENGTADLVEDLTVTDATGAPLALEPLGTGDWRVPGGAAGQPVRVSYRLRLDHGDYAWGPGIDEVAYRTGDGLFLTGRALFLVPGESLPEGAEVAFHLPGDWKASLPWPVTDGRARVADLNGLLRNCMFLGTHYEETLTLGEFSFVLVLGRDLVDSRELLKEAMAPALPAAVDIFGGMSRETRYLVVFNRFDGRTDGGAFAASYSMLVNGPVNRLSSVIWGHGIVHEVLHFWNGHTLVPESYEEEWFKEGITDYLTILIRSRHEMDPRERVYRKLENSMRRYLLSRMLLGVQASLREAGREKHRHRMLVYGGGTLVGLCLDVRIRQATGNTRGLEDLLAAMYDEFHEPGTAYDLEDIIRLAGEVSGVDQRDFLTRYVDGAELLDPAPYVRAMGLQLDTMVDEFYLGEMPEATAEQRAIRTAILGDPAAAPSR